MIGPYYVGQVPADPLVLTVSRDDGTPRDISAYTTVSLLIYDASGTPVDTSAGTVERPTEVGEIIYHWPTTSLFNSTGTYRYQISLDGPGTIHDLTGVGTFDVLAIGSVEFVPSVGELAVFWGDEAPTDDVDWDVTAANVLQQATDLLFMVTGMGDLPTDARQARLVQYAIMDMAILLYISDPSEAYSPYSSERIGSYSYTLKQNAQKGTTGAFWWDTVVAAIRDGEWNTAVSLVVAGEQVFHQGYGRFYRSERLLHASPLAGPQGEFDPSFGEDRWLPFGATSDGSWAHDPYDWPY